MSIIIYFVSHMFFNVRSNFDDFWGVTFSKIPPGSSYDTQPKQGTFFFGEFFVKITIPSRVSYPPQKK